MVTSKTIDEIDEAKEKEDLKKLEAVFFVSGRFLNMQELISLTDLNPIIIKGLIEKLKEKYDSQDSAIQIIEKTTQKSKISDAPKSGAVPTHRTGEDFGGMWKMDVGSEYSYLINKLAAGSSEFSKAEQETLAIIAFKQPIKQSVVVKIRGNKAYDHIKKFAGLGLIRKKKMGHTNELTLSEEFYDYFNVQDSEKGILDRVKDSDNKNESLQVKEGQQSLKEKVAEE